MAAQYEARSVNLTADLFTLAVHPTRPLFAAGLSSGHVYSYTWPTSSSSSADEDPNDSDDDETPAAAPTETDYTIAWKTHRHKNGGCRSAVYSHDGLSLYTAGKDGILKAASSETGRVVSKSILPKDDAASILLPLSAQHLLLGTDEGNIHLFDLRTPTTLPAKANASWLNVHDDHISSLLALPATAASTTGFSRTYISTGDTTLSSFDVRKPGKALARSEPQEDEILCSSFTAHAPSRNTGGSEKVMTGTSSGVVTTWNKGFWEDHQERIPLSRKTGDSIDSIITLTEDFEISGAGYGTFFAAGSGDGKVRIVKMGGNKVGDLLEGLEEGVSALAVDCDGRIVSGGGLVVKIWSEKEAQEVEEEEEEEEKEGKKRKGGDSDDDSDDDSDVEGESSDDEKEKKKRKKRKRTGGKGKAKSAGVKNVHSFAGLD
ncbi:Similar to WD repeat-containing protein jip5; acc. no. A6RWR8 [Pyronema omphalodes CBS 100304]|uniref:WD repeat-containing protein JIP5 n=1 Tax=Pyronema omphalodes (strain CBS 100304) TaxID=1076935 RepID=U4LCB1_PYROM|nr:Similar to WD repeat-containing protein jip5; acc. no. A6RWR8 [Pyronema omphalodes CBS 100304]